MKNTGIKLFLTSFIGLSLSYVFPQPHYKSQDVLTALQQNLKNNEFNLQAAITRKNTIKPILKNIVENLTRSYPNMHASISDTELQQAMGNYIYSVARAKRVDINKTYKDYGDQLIREINDVIDDVYTRSKNKNSFSPKSSAIPLLEFIENDLKKNELALQKALEKRETIKPILMRSFIMVSKNYPEYKNSLDDITMALSDYLYALAVASNIDLNQRDAQYGLKLIDDINNSMTEALLEKNTGQSKQTQATPRLNTMISALQRKLKDNEFKVQVTIARKNPIKTLLKEILTDFIQKNPTYKNTITEQEMVKVVGDYIESIAKSKKIDLENQDQDYGNKLITEINDVLEELYS